MPQWAGSSWYYLRYMDPHNDSALVDKTKEKYWSPVDMYVGGAEHATRHLIYARFWHKFLYDIGAVNETEPFKRLQHVGLIMASDGRKMSKRYGNVINPDDIVDTFGADSLRIYEMFMGPFSQSIAWSTDNIMGARRLIEKIWRMQEKIDKGILLDKSTETLLHLSIKKISEDIEQFAFNTAISQLMILANHLEKLEKIPEGVFEQIILLIAPFAPHVAEELWNILGRETPLYRESWPLYDPQKTISETVIIGVQINGKLRDTIESGRSETKEEILEIALMRPIVKKWLEDNKPKKVIYVPGKILNIVL
jgi:leucyl-tRNA synthetase